MKYSLSPENEWTFYMSLPENSPSTPDSLSFFSFLIIMMMMILNFSFSFSHTHIKWMNRKVLGNIFVACILFCWQNVFQLQCYFPVIFILLLLLLSLQNKSSTQHTVWIDKKIWIEPNQQTRRPAGDKHPESIIIVVVVWYVFHWLFTSWKFRIYIRIILCYNKHSIDWNENNNKMNADW